MNTHRFIIFISVTTVVAWAGWVLTMVSVDPLYAGILGRVLFFCFAFCAMAGTIGVVEFLLRGRRHTGSMHTLMRDVVRHGILFSAFFVALLILLASDLFTWWTIVPFVLALGCIELAFLQVRRDFTEHKSEEDAAC